MMHIVCTALLLATVSAAKTLPTETQCEEFIYSIISDASNPITDVQINTCKTHAVRRTHPRVLCRASSPRHAR